MAKVISTIRLRRNTASAWTGGNPTLLQGEPAYESDTGKLKIGDGSSNWVTLPYFGAATTQDLTDVTITGPIADNEVLAYNLATTQWTNQTLAEAGIQPAGSYAAASHTHVPANITAYTTAGTAATYVNQWTKFASVTLTGQYQDAQAAIQFVSYGDGSTAVGGANIRFKVKQQTAFGTNPYVQIAVERGANLTAANFSATIVQNTPSTIVDLYIQIPDSYRAYNFNPVAISGASFISWLQNQAFVASVPAGVGVVAGSADFGTVYGAFSGSLTGNVTGNTSGTAGSLSPGANINGVSFTGSSDIIIPTTYDSSYHRITNPGGGTYVTSSSSLTGAIKVTLPVGATNTMVRMTIKVYEYATGESFDIVCGGYMYSVGNTWANNPFAYIIGDPDIDRRFAVRFGYTAAGKMVVYIGELASTWSIPQIFVTDVQLGYSGQSATWTTGWSIGFETTAFENVTATITNSQVGFQASANTANSVVLRDASGNFSAGAITATSIGLTTALAPEDGGMPTGGLIPFAGATAPTGYLFCDGTEKAIATYGTLYAVLGTTYGALTNGSGGVGTTHFRVPDLRGRTPIGVGTVTDVNSRTAAFTRGTAGGEIDHRLTTANMPSHSHGGSTGSNYAYNTTEIYTNGGGSAFVANTWNLAYVGGDNQYRDRTYHNHSITAEGGGGYHNNLQPYLVLNYIIKT